MSAVWFTLGVWTGLALRGWLNRANRNVRSIEAAYEQAHTEAIEGPVAPDTGRDRSQGAPDRGHAAAGSSWARRN